MKGDGSTCTTTPLPGLKHEFRCCAHSPAECGHSVDGGLLCTTTPLPGLMHELRCYVHSPAECGHIKGDGSRCTNTPRSGSKCCLHSPEIQQEIEILKGNCADYDTNHARLVVFSNKFLCEGSIAFVFFAGYGRLVPETNSNIEKLEKVVREQGKHVADFVRHELTVSFNQKLDEEHSFPPEYDKQKGETYFKMLGQCARKSALTLEKEMVNIITCSNKISGGGGSPPKYRWGCSIATTSIIILVPRSNSDSSSASDGSHGFFAARAGPASDEFQDTTIKKRVQNQKAGSTSTDASAASMNSDTGEEEEPKKRMKME